MKSFGETIIVLASKGTCTGSTSIKDWIPFFANAKWKCVNDDPPADVIPKANLVTRRLRHYSAKEGSEFHSRGYTVAIPSPFIPDFRLAHESKIGELVPREKSLKTMTDSGAHTVDSRAELENFPRDERRDEIREIRRLSECGGEGRNPGRGDNIDHRGWETGTKARRGWLGNGRYNGTFSC